MLRISQGGGDTTTIRLTVSQGQEIRSYLEKHTDCRFTTYCAQVGIEYTNIVAMLSGRKKISVKTLVKLFSKTELEVECRTEFIIQKADGKNAPDALCVNLDEELFLEGMEKSTEEQLNETEPSNSGQEKSSKETNQNNSALDHLFP